MAYCYPDECGEYTVTPMLVSSPCYQAKCSEEPPLCYPCLPACPKGQIVYCCERRPPKARPKTPIYDESCEDCCETRERQPSGRQCPRRRYRSPPSTRQTPCLPQQTHESCCQPTCKPIKTKYVIPCYRYEDGRIDNQPTELMRRACEVAIGTRRRRKPFVESTFCADPYNEVHRYHSEDERGNCCFHYERKKPCTSHCPDHRHRAQSINCLPSCQTCASCPQCQYVNYVQARKVGPHKSCCYYCD